MSVVSMMLSTAHARSTTTASTEAVSSSEISNSCSSTTVCLAGMALGESGVGFDRLTGLLLRWA